MQTPEEVAIKSYAESYGGEVIKLSDKCTVIFNQGNSIWEFILNNERRFMMVSTDLEEQLRLYGLLKEGSPTLVKIFENPNHIRPSIRIFESAEMTTVVGFDFVTSLPYVKTVIATPQEATK